MGHDKMNESSTTKLKYPKSVAFIISKEFCERFNYYGMRTILVLYLTRRLGYNDDSATVLFHVFTSVAYLFPLFGAIVADSWLGRFKTILSLSIVYAIGSIVISVGAIPTLHLPARELTIIGLLLIAIGTGGIKPCVSAFGGDQFKIPEQTKQLATFFSLFYLAINAGSLISTSITPILREDVHCFGELECFSLGFGVPGILMVIAICIFVAGKPFYRIQKPSGNMVVTVSKCIGEAIKVRSKLDRSSIKAKHWLDYAEPKYGQSTVNDIKALLKILLIFVPLPIFWALFDQQGSRWTFQATHMIGNIGNVTIKPDQMQVLNALLIVVFIPLFDLVIYPMLKLCGIQRPLQKLTLGMICAGIAFFVSGLLELKLQTTYPILPGENESQLRIFNGFDHCHYNVTTDFEQLNSFTVDAMDYVEFKNLSVNNVTSINYNMTPTVNSSSSNCPRDSGIFVISPKEATSYFIKTNSLNKSEIMSLRYKDFPGMPEKGYPLVRILASTDQLNEIVFQNIAEDYSKRFNSSSIELIEIPGGTYRIYVGDKNVSVETLQQGGVYTIMLSEMGNQSYVLKKSVITQPNSIHILWQIPQYVIMTIGEIMFSVTGLEFSFTQAPESMKSVLQACWLLTVSFGNIIVIVIAEVKFFNSQASEFFLFSALMAVDVIFFIALAMRYRYINLESNKLNGDDISVRNGTNQPFEKDGLKHRGYENQSYVSEL